MSKAFRLTFALACSVLLTSLYLLGCRYLVEGDPALSFSYMAGGPFAIGVVGALCANYFGFKSLAQAIFTPWVGIFVFFVAAILIQWETLICAVILALPYMAASTIGSVLAYLLLRRKSPPRPATFSYALASLALPLLVLPIEVHFDGDEEFHFVRNERLIEAGVEDVWREVKSVRRIEEREQNFHWLHALGFPQPLEASLSGEGVGAYRLAEFEHSLVFKEVITEWKPLKKISFRIDAEEIPTGVIDYHIRFGGPHFDVLEGSYELIPISESQTKVILKSKHRLKTRFNFYSRIWTKYIMSELQSYILDVVVRRAEL